MNKELKQDKKVDYIDYLDQLLQSAIDTMDIDESNTFYDCWNITTEYFKFQVTDEFTIEVRNNGDYSTVRLLNTLKDGRSYKWIIILKKVNGYYGLIETDEICEYAFGSSCQGYRSEYALNEAHNMVAKVNPNYKHYDWEDWMEYYNKVIKACYHVGIINRNTENEREILVNF